jgi:hypothetical protein
VADEEYVAHSRLTAHPNTINLIVCNIFIAEDTTESVTGECITNPKATIDVASRNQTLCATIALEGNRAWSEGAQLAERIMPQTDYRSIHAGQSSVPD